MSKKFFIDAEFIDDGRTLDLISLGVVCEDGREFYAQNADCNLYSADWVRANVFPHLTNIAGAMRFDSAALSADGPSIMVVKEPAPPWFYRRQIAERLCDFVGDSTPEWWGSCSAYDHVALSQLFGPMVNLPKGWPYLTKDVQQWAEQLGLPRDWDDSLPHVGTAHNALDDARWTRAAFEYLAGVERGMLYAPGALVCGECGFRLNKMVMSDGAVGVDAGAHVEFCPNDESEMLPVTWKREVKLTTATYLSRLP